eukprot:613051-Prorocentrum_minimum.AAC.1
METPTEGSCWHCTSAARSVAGWPGGVARLPGEAARSTSGVERKRWTKCSTKAGERTNSPSTCTAAWERKRGAGGRQRGAEISIYTNIAFEINVPRGEGGGRR